MERCSVTSQPNIGKRDAKGELVDLRRSDAKIAIIRRNHRIEEALSEAVECDDYGPFDTLLSILSRPFDDQREFAAFAEPAPERQDRYVIFCST